MIKGYFFTGATSAKTNASLYYNKEGYVGFNEGIKDGVKFDAIKISSRLGNTPRYINFPDGALFETENNDAVDEMVKALSSKALHGLAYKLESAKAFVLFTLITVVFFAWLFIQFGIPYFSKEVASTLPEEASQYMGSGVLEVMDKSWFRKSELSQQRQNKLRALFNGLLKNNEYYKVEFRLGGKIKANAFALPNGTIVFTDELINLAENDLEIVAIMLHEIGHLKHRHSLRATIQQFSLAMFVMLVTGDVSSSSSIITAIPIILVESGFSQSMEAEADDYSLNYMLQNNINPNYFAVIMEKLEASYLPEYDECAKKGSIIKCIKEAVLLNKTNNNKTNVLSYFSTHPSSEDRIKRFQNLR